ncbi:MAG: HK97 family phage prohead protease [Pseudomonadota bacterium]|nr:HK97 family phage prohead protease [Pseudomonadota bacterium]QKK04370.1 MAG: HK97 family phage prohead protease [Pseudomonadota bacterium]
MTGQFLQAAFGIEKAGETGVFEGYASVFDEIDNVKDRVASGAFRASLETHRRQGRMPPLLWQHDMREPVGVLKEVYEDKKGLRIRGQLFIEDIPRARQAHRLMKENGLSGLSIGFRAAESAFDPGTGVRTLLKIDLMEISLVTFPALDSARVAGVKAALQSGNMPPVRAFEGFLRDAGFSRKQAKGIIACGYHGLKTAPRDAAEDVNDGGSAEEADILLNLADRLRELAL